MPTLTLANAQQIFDAALGGERSPPDRCVAVTVRDAGAHPVALARRGIDSAGFSAVSH